MTSQIDMQLFYLSHGLVRVCEIALSHMDKNNGNPDVMCGKKNLSFKKELEILYPDKFN